MLACLLAGCGMPLLAQIAGLCRGKWIFMFSSTRGSGAAVMQVTEDPRGSRGEDDGYLRWEARKGDRVSESPCSSSLRPGFGGDVISVILSYSAAAAGFLLLGPRAKARSWSRAEPSSKGRALQPHSSASHSPWQQGRTE